MASRNFNSREKKDKFIYQLPFSVTQQICRNLDLDKSWKKLASEIGYTYQDVHQFAMEAERGRSATEALFSDWGCQNPTASDLYHKLKSINRLREMQVMDAWLTSGSDSKPGSSSAHPSISPSSSHDSFYGHPSHIDTDQLPKPPARHKTGRQNSSPSKLAGGGQNSLAKLAGGGQNSSAKQAWKSQSTSKNADVNLNSDNFNPVDKSSKNKYIPDVPQKDHVNKSLSSSVKDKSLLKGEKMFSHPLKCPTQNGSSREIKSLSEPRFLGGDSTLESDNTHAYSYKEISQATNGFSSSHCIGKGTYGAVYKGRIKNTDCAFKLLYTESDEDSLKKLLKELKNLTKYRHENIVPLYAYTFENNEVCLVYQFMQNGSLFNKLHCLPSAGLGLTWLQRLAILRGAACGLQYLHTLDKCPLIHGHIKSANILLDRHLEAKISDLGMACHASGGSATGALTHFSKEEKNTDRYRDIAYQPPEAVRGSQMSIKGDTYSFGIVVLETCIGKKAYDETGYGPNMYYLVDFVSNSVESGQDIMSIRDLRAGTLLQHLSGVLLQIGIKCIQKLKKQRPELEKIYNQLEMLEKQAECELKSIQGVDSYQEHDLHYGINVKCVQESLSSSTPPSQGSIPQGSNLQGSKFQGSIPQGSTPQRSLSQGSNNSQGPVPTESLPEVPVNTQKSQNLKPCSPSHTSQQPRDTAPEQRLLMQDSVVEQSPNQSDISVQIKQLPFNSKKENAEKQNSHSIQTNEKSSRLKISVVDPKIHDISEVTKSKINSLPTFQRPVKSQSSRNSVEKTLSQNSAPVIPSSCGQENASKLPGPHALGSCSQPFSVEDSPHFVSLDQEENQQVIESRETLFQKYEKYKQEMDEANEVEYQGYNDEFVLSCDYSLYSTNGEAENAILCVENVGSMDFLPSDEERDTTNQMIAQTDYGVTDSLDATSSMDLFGDDFSNSCAISERLGPAREPQECDDDSTSLDEKKSTSLFSLDSSLKSEEYFSSGLPGSQTETHVRKEEVNSNSVNRYPVSEALWHRKRPDPTEHYMV